MQVAGAMKIPRGHLNAEFLIELQSGTGSGLQMAT